MDEKNGSYFNQVVRDAINEVKKGHTGYCFTEEQVREVAKRFDVTEYKVVDGIFYIRTDKPKKVKKDEKAG